MCLETLAGELKNGAVVLAATRRLARQLRRRFCEYQASKGLAAWRAPKILFWEDWLVELWSIHGDGSGSTDLILSSDQEQLLWEQVIQSGSEPGEFLLRVPGAATAAAHSWRLAHDWGIAPQTFNPGADPDARAFQRWVVELVSRLKDNRWITRAQVLGAIPCSGLGHMPVPAHSVVWAGFSQYTPLLKGLRDALNSAGVCQHELEPRAKKAKIVRVGCPDRHRQFTEIARWARALHDQNAESSIGVVFPDLKGCRDDLQAVLEDVLHADAPWSGEPRLYHISYGRPLADFPIIHIALSLLRWSLKEIPFTDVSRVLLSPYISGWEGEQDSRAGLESEIRDRDRDTLTLRMLLRKTAANPGRSALHAAVTRALELKRPSSREATHWARYFADWLDAFGWPGERALPSSEYQLIDAWRELLSGFASLSQFRSHWTQEAASQMLVRLARKRVFQFQDQGAPVQIFGLSEAPGLGFDHLWIADMGDDVWPPPVRPDPFLPVGLQREHGLPGCDSETAVTQAEATVAQLISIAPDIVVSHVQFVDEVRVALTPVFMPLSEPGPLALDPYSGRIDQLQQDSTPVEMLSDQNAPPLAKPCRAGGVAVVQDQSLCPFRGFAHHRLRVRELEAVEAGLSAATHGTLFHGVMAAFWQQMRTHERLTESGDHALEEVLSRCIDEILSRRPGYLELDRPLMELERNRLQSLALEWLQQDLAREPFSVDLTEEERTLELAGVEFRLRIDRMDRTDQGGVVVIDYKTGNVVSHEDWFKLRPSEPQLPMYAISVNEPVVAVAYAKAKRGECRYSGLADAPVSTGLRSFKDAGVDDAASSKLMWQRSLTDIAEEFAAGFAAVQPSGPQACRWCDLKPLCRIDERARSLDARG